MEVTIRKAGMFSLAEIMVYHGYINELCGHWQLPWKKSKKLQWEHLTFLTLGMELKKSTLLCPFFWLAHDFFFSTDLFLRTAQARNFSPSMSVNINPHLLSSSSVLLWQYFYKTICSRMVYHFLPQGFN